MFLQKCDYFNGKCNEPDQKRKLYKLFLAFMLTDLVNEKPLEEVIDYYYPQNGSMEKRMAVHGKDVKTLQVLSWLPMACVANAAFE
jgi:hypothetical protein